MLVKCHVVFCTSLNVCVCVCVSIGERVGTSHRRKLLTHYSSLYETPHYLWKLQTAVLSRQHWDRIAMQLLEQPAFKALGTKHRYTVQHINVCILMCVELLVNMAEKVATC